MANLIWSIIAALGGILVIGVVFYYWAAPDQDRADEREARLVVLGPEYPHQAKNAQSPARKEAAQMLDTRGAGPRLCRNMVVFLAPDQTRLGELEQGVRQYLAWKSIEAEREALNLDAFQANQARTKREHGDQTVDQRVPETFQWLLVPFQSDPHDPIEWQEIRLQGQEALAVRASRKLKNDELLVTQFGGTRLRHELDKIPLWRGDHVAIKQLVDDFGRYLYLPRLKEAAVLLSAVRDGCALLTWEQDAFAYAESYDEAAQRYRGLRGGQQKSRQRADHRDDREDRVRRGHPASVARAQAQRAGAVPAAIERRKATTCACAVGSARRSGSVPLAVRCRASLSTHASVSHAPLW